MIWAMSHNLMDLSILVWAFSLRIHYPLMQLLPFTGLLAGTLLDYNSDHVSLIFSLLEYASYHPFSSRDLPEISCNYRSNPVFVYQYYSQDLKFHWHEFHGWMKFMAQNNILAWNCCMYLIKNPYLWSYICISFFS